MANSSANAFLPPMWSVIRPVSGDASAPPTDATAMTAPSSARLMSNSSMMKVASSPSATMRKVPDAIAATRRPVNAVIRPPLAAIGDGGSPEAGGIGGVYEPSHPPTERVAAG